MLAVGSRLSIVFARKIMKDFLRMELMELVKHSDAVADINESSKMLKISDFWLKTAIFSQKSTPGTPKT